MDQLVIKIVELKGSYFQIGVTQGKLEKISHPFPFNQEYNPIKALKMLEMVSPNLMEELKGIANGMLISMDSVLEQYSGYNVSFPEMGCTALVQNNCYIRNYDFSPELYDARLVLSQPKNGYASVGFSEHLMGRLDGMNEKGLVIGLHFVNQSFRKEGFLATTIVRMVLDHCATTEEAIQLLKDVPHGYCYNFSVTDKNGKSAVIEASPSKQVVQYTEPLLCTNHFEIDEMKPKNRRNIQGSINRKQYLSELIKQNLSPLETYKIFNHEKSPLFFHHYRQYFGTLHTVVYSPNDLNVLVGVGQNCDPLIFSFEHWLKGDVKIPSFIKGIISDDHV